MSNVLVLKDHKIVLDKLPDDLNPVLYFNRVLDGVLEEFGIKKQRNRILLPQGSNIRHIVVHSPDFSDLGRVDIERLLNIFEKKVEKKFANTFETN